MGHMLINHYREENGTDPILQIMIVEDEHDEEDQITDPNYHHSEESHHDEKHGVGTSVFLEEIVVHLFFELGESN